MKQLKKIIFPFIVFYSLALFSCSKDNSQTVYVGDFTFREPPASLWQKADESQKNSIQEWTIGGIKNYPQYMYIHNETGSTFVVSTIYFENSDPADIEETVSVYMKEFEKGDVKRQALLSPIVIDAGSTLKEVILSNVKTFEDMGFEIDDFSASSIIIREIPAMFSPVSARETVLEMAEELKNTGISSVSTNRTTEEAMVQLICSAIK